MKSAEVLGCRKPGLVIGSTVEDLPVLRHVLTPGAERVLENADAAAENGAHLVLLRADELAKEVRRHSGEFALAEAIVRLMSSSVRNLFCIPAARRPMPSASAMSVT